MKYVVLLSFGLMATMVSAPFAGAQSDFAAQQTRLLEEARSNLSNNPGNAEALIWVGRRLGYLGRYAEAIAV